MTKQQAEGRTRHMGSLADRTDNADDLEDLTLSAPITVSAYCLTIVSETGENCSGPLQWWTRAVKTRRRRVKVSSSLLHVR